MHFIPITETLDPEQLDMMLAFGYYRMQQNLFTTNYAHTDSHEPIRVIWARVLASGYQPNSRHQKLKRLNRRFQTSLQDADVTEEIEALYARYRAAIDFDGNESVRSCLLGDKTRDFFPGKMWTVRDAGRLIAVGYFDEGQQSCAGILNFFHPEYRKFSLGLWLYLEGLQYAADKGKRFFYPGYISQDFPKFDYKLLAGTERIELWHPAHQFWMPYAVSKNQDMD